jgi:hypothetical protein
MPEVWGENASVFDPYRWYKEDGKKVTYSPFSEIKSGSFSPFSWLY